MMVALGALVIVISIYLMLKRYDSRLILTGAGILMAAMAGKPMAALDAFAKEMANGGLITSVCSVMGFALVMKFTGCDKHLEQPQKQRTLNRNPRDRIAQNYAN